MPTIKSKSTNDKCPLGFEYCEHSCYFWCGSEKRCLYHFEDIVLHCGGSEYTYNRDTGWKKE